MKALWRWLRSSEPTLPELHEHLIRDVSRIAFCHPWEFDHYD